MTMGFTKLQLNEKLLKGIVDAGFSSCMPVQEETLAHTLHGRDVYVQSQTGTGKTAAFLISIFQLQLHDPAMEGKKALIVAPTRELAVQIQEEARLLGRYLDQRVGCFYGGVPYAKQEKLLSGGVDIIIGTPGRLLDFHQQGKLNFRDVGLLVIDEADRLFDMGFLPDIRRIVKKCPPPGQRRSMLFSATLDFRARELAWEHMNAPVEIEITPDKRTVEGVVQELYHVAREEKMGLLLGILKREQPASLLVFTNTKNAAEAVALRLRKNDFPCEFITGDLPQKKRMEVIEGIKSGNIRFVVATDVAARGLHIDDLELVVNYDLPQDGESYVHRIGRTARAGKQGKAVTLSCDRYVLSLEAIEAYIQQKIPVTWPDEAFFETDRVSAPLMPQARRRPDRRDASRTGRSSGRRSDNTPGGRRPPRDRTQSRSAERTSDRPERGRAAPSEKAQARAAKRTAPDRTSGKGPRAEMSEAERIAYYREKYGEEFTPSPGSSGTKKKPAAGRKKKSGTPARAAAQPRKNAPGPARPESAAPSSPPRRRSLLGRLLQRLSGRD